MRESKNVQSVPYRVGSGWKGVVAVREVKVIRTGPNGKVWHEGEARDGIGCTPMHCLSIIRIANSVN